MTFKNWSLAVATLMLVAPLSASALGISIAGVSSSGGDANTVAVGDTITFDLVLENNGGEAVQALGLGVYGYDTGAQGDPTDNRLVFAGGQQGISVFNTAYVPGVNVNGLGDADGVVTEDGIGFPISETLRVNLYEGVSFTGGSTGDGSFDNGVAGGQTNGGDVHFQVTFQAQNIGIVTGDSLTIEFGSGQFGNVALGAGGTAVGFNNASYTLTVIPEPGTALLMGLGLAGLAARRR